MKTTQHWGSQMLSVSSAHRLARIVTEPRLRACGNIPCVVNTAATSGDGVQTAEMALLESVHHNPGS
jgi:hypothetical protein